MSAQNVTDQDFQNEVIESPQPVLVDFWAPWCGPCRMMSPVVDELANDIGDKVKVVKVNVDEAAEAAARFSIQSIPTFAIVKDGVVQRQLGGIQSKEALQEALNA